MGEGREQGMHKRHIVRPTEEERRTCDATSEELKGSSQKARRAKVLLQADVDRPAGRGGLPAPNTNRGECAAALRAGTLEQALNGKQRSSPPVPKLLNGDRPPDGRGRWAWASGLFLHGGPGRKSPRSAGSLRIWSHRSRRGGILAGSATQNQRSTGQRTEDTLAHRSLPARTS